MNQSKIASVKEALTNTAIGYVFSVMCQVAVFPLYGIHIPFNQDMQIVGIFTVLSVIRNYCIRRWFNCKQRGEAWIANNAGRTEG